LQLEARVVQQAAGERKPSPLAGEGLDEGLGTLVSRKVVPGPPPMVVEPSGAAGRVETTAGPV